MFALKALLSALLLSQSAFALTQSLLFQIPGKDLKKVQKSSADVLKCVQDFKGTTGVAAGFLVEDANRYAVLIDWTNQADATAAKTALQANKQAYAIFQEYLIEDYLYAFRAPVVPNITPARHIVERYTSTLGPSVTPEALKAAVDILDAYIIGQIGHFQVSTTAVGNPTKLIALVPWESTEYHYASRNSSAHIAASAPSYALAQSDYYGTHIDAKVY